MSEPPEQLPRRIGLIGAVALAFNGAVAASVFALPATLAADFGNFSPWLFPIVGLAALLIVVPFTWSVAAFPESGGPAAYGRVFGRFVGFEAGWIYYIARATAFAANANVLTAYLARWLTGRTRVGFAYCCYWPRRRCSRQSTSREYVNRLAC